ncbi:amino acid permease [Rothia endophytica]|uniref:amino acid permease n=1 Tax=Rothia endophytica TaxID=1324766 RepID=UPI001F1E3208|nr:amino acid permease [Rothia endophytica]
MDRPKNSPYDNQVSPETSAGMRVHLNDRGEGVNPNDRSTKHLKSALSNRHITMITLGGIIGASLFVGSGNIIRSVGPAAIISYLIGGLLVFLAMRMLGEMAASRPTTGSFMEYARIGLGDWAAYLVGWLYWYFWVGVLAYEALLSSQTLHLWFPAIPSWAGGVAMLLLFLFVNIISVRTFGEVEFWLASVKVITIVIFLGVGVLFVLGLWPNSTPSVSNLWEHGGFAPHGFGLAFTGVALVIFSYFGTEIAVMAAAESRDPAKGVRQATSTVIWRILLFFVGAVLIICMVIPWNQLPEPVNVAAAPFTQVFSLYGLPGAEIIMQLVIFTAVISVLNSGLYSASRMFAALAKQGYAPGFIAKQSKNGVPIYALVASTLGGFLATFAEFLAPSSGIFDFIMNSAGLVALFVYVFIALTHISMRRKMTKQEVDGLKLKMWLFPWLNYLLIAGIFFVFVVMLFTEGGRAQVFTSLIATGVLVLFWPAVKKKLRIMREADPSTAQITIKDVSH